MTTTIDDAGAKPCSTPLNTWCHKRRQIEGGSCRPSNEEANDSEEDSQHDDDE